MADFSIFDPAGAVAGMLAPNPDLLRQRWDEYLNDPKTQAALLSFGAQAAQPMQWGQSGFGHLMSSVAQGGAGVRQEEGLQMKEREEERKQQETDSKQTLRESQATLAESRAANAGLSARNAEDRLGMRQRELESRNENLTLGRRMQAYRLYGEYVRATQKANENEQLMRGRNAVIKPIQSPEEWFRSNPSMLTSIGLTPDQLQTPAPGGGDGQPVLTSPPGGGPAPNPPPTGSGTSQPPRPGQVINGYRFKGGNPRDRNNWEPVGG